MKPKIEEEPINKRCRVCGGMIVRRRLVFEGLDVVGMIHLVMRLGVDGYHCSGCGLMYNKVP